MSLIKNYVFIATVLIGILTFSACDDDDNPSNQTQITNNVQSGTWKITYFFDTDTDETSDFVGYVFTFGTDGSLTATNGSNTYTGTWSITDSNSNDDSIDDLHFVITFITNSDFDDLTDDWDIISQSGSKIELIDVSGGNGGTDYLTFEKI